MRDARKSGSGSGPSWSDWQELPGWSDRGVGPAFERELREVSLLCGDEGARQLRRGLCGQDAIAVRAALTMIDLSASALAAAVLKDLCARLLAQPEDQVLAAVADCADLIDALLAGLAGTPPGLAH